MNEQGIVVGREAFMRNIANRLGRKEPLSTPPEQPVSGVPEHYAAVQLSQDDKVELFVQNWTALSGKALIVPREGAAETIRAYLSQVCADHGVRRVARWSHEQLESLGLDAHLEAEGIHVVPWEEPDSDRAAELENLAIRASNGESNWQGRSPLLRAAETCELGLVWPDYAIANTSTLALLSHGGQGRSVSLLTSILFAVFHADQLVTRMGEAFDEVRRRFPGMQPLPSSINLITGPSRSADIENDLTIGIHGPGKVYAVIIQ